MSFESFFDAQKKVDAIKDFRAIKQSYKNLKQSTANNLEDKSQGTLSQLNNIKQDVKRFKREVKSQFEELLSFSQLGFLGSENEIPNPFQGRGQNPFQGAKEKLDNSSSLGYLKKKMIQALKKIEPDVGKIMFEESLRAIGCSHEQAYPNVPNPASIYINVKSIDLFDLLKLDPTEVVGESRFERANPSPGIKPYPTNKELWLRIQNSGQIHTYIGGSGQALFDIQYTTTGPAGQSGDFFKVDLKNRLSGLAGVATTTNRVGDFVADYYKSIRLVDFSAIFSQLIEVLMGAVSIKLELGTDKIEDQTKFSLLIQRILGLCFDSRSEIDVSGVAKIAELDGFDDSFFEFNEIDLRYVNERTTNIYNKVAEFESCGDVKLNFDYDKIVNAVSQLNAYENQGDLDNQADQLSDVIVETLNEELQSLQKNLALSASYPTIQDLKIDVDFNFIANLPRSFIFSLLSPKVLLPIFIMLKAIQQLGASAINTICQDEINSMQDFFKCFKTFIKNLVSKIGALFVKELFDLIKKDIRNLIQAMIRDLAKEQVTKQYAMILALIQLLLILVQFVKDWRKCKSVLDELFALLELGLSFAPSIPTPLLQGAKLSSGTSPSRALINSIQEMQSVGIPTGPLPDGSPNLFVMSQLCQMKGQDLENAQNGKTEVHVLGSTSGPVGFANFKAVGKAY